MKNQLTIERDFAAFSDSAIPVTIDGKTIRWRRNRDWYSADLTEIEDTEWPEVVFNGRTLSYESFFASEAMADLLDASAKAIEYWTSLPGHINPSEFVSAPARTEGDSGTVDSIVKQLVDANRSALDSTHVVFLHGAAGAGKTGVLRQLAVNSATEYSCGKSAHFLLYLDAQEQSLSKLDDLVARALSDIKVKFTYHALATLTRLGLIVPVIDGFDELLGYGGYREAFASLRTFIGRLSGAGTLVTSARSSFYEYSELKQIGRSASEYRVTTIELLDWSDNTLLEYARKLVADDSSAASLVRAAKHRLSAELHPLLGSAFFATRVIQLMRLPDSDSIGSAKLREELIRQLIEREVGKLSDGDSILTSQQHREFAFAIAEEMWLQERTDLDRDTLKTIAEIKCEDFGITGELANTVIQRSSTHALLRPSVRERLAFQHEFYLAYFLGGFVASVLSSQTTDVTNVMAVRVLSEVVAASIAFHISERIDSFDRIARLLGTKSVRSGVDSVFRQNLGMLIVSLLRVWSGKVDNVVVRNADFSSVSFSNIRASRVLFQNCEFVDATLEDATLLSCEFSCCRIERVILSNTTNLSGSNFAGENPVIGVSDDGGAEFQYQPAEAERIFVAHGAIAWSVVPPTRVELSANAIRLVAFVRKVLNIARRTCLISSEDIENRHLSQDDWELITRMLVRHGLCSRKTISRRGTSGAIIQLDVQAAQLAEGESILGGRESSSIRPDVLAFWQELSDIQ